LSGMSSEELDALMAEVSRQKNAQAESRRANYESLRKDLMNDVSYRLMEVVDDVTDFHDWLEGEVKAFSGVMREYGQTKNEDQISFTLIEGDFKMEVKGNRVKGFDERADIAAERLIEYLRRYMEKSSKGTEDPMYQLAMTLLERNKQGALDYKSISKLYELEPKFDAEYGEIMKLFRESNVVMRNAVNYYFSKKGADGVWHRIEPSFCRL